MLKIWPKNCGRVLYKYRRQILYGAISGGLLTVSFILGVFVQGACSDRTIAFWRSIAATPQPEVCALCGNGHGPRYHAPVLVNLSTGSVGELRVYDPDPQQKAGLAAKQSTGTFSFLHVAGLTGYRDTYSHTSHVTLTKELAPMDPSFFCRDCRALLAGASTKGYVLADLHDLDRITVYTVAEGAEYAIRDYAVSISCDKDLNSLSVDVTGCLEDESHK